MDRAILIAVCAFSLTSCTNYLPSFAFLQPSPSTEQLHIVSEPDGAEATSSQGSTCQTPCELAVPSGSDLSVTVAKSGYQTMTVPVHPESAGGQLQPNPVLAQLQPALPPKRAKRPSAKRNSTPVPPAQ
jgi:hypothetical protein